MFMQSNHMVCFNYAIILVAYYESMLSHRHSCVDPMKLSTLNMEYFSLRLHPLVKVPLHGKYSDYQSYPGGATT